MADRQSINKLTYKMIGLCYEIHNKLGNNYKEIYYQRIFEYELKRNKISYEREKRFNLIYKDTVLGKHYADFVVENKLVIEFKTMPILRQEDTHQILCYMKSLKIRFGLLVNFRSKKVQVKRLILPDKYLD